MSTGHLPSGSDRDHGDHDGDDVETFDQASRLQKKKGNRPLVAKVSRAKKSKGKQVQREVSDEDGSQVDASLSKSYQ